jgi:hypothetical protein
MDFKARLVRKNEESYFILIKGTIQQKNIKIVNTYVWKVGIPNFINQIP